MNLFLYYDDTYFATCLKCMEERYGMCYAVLVYWEYITIFSPGLKPLHA